MRGRAVCPEVVSGLECLRWREAQGWPTQFLMGRHNPHTFACLIRTLGPGVQPTVYGAPVVRAHLFVDQRRPRAAPEPATAAEQFAREFWRAALEKTRFPSDSLAISPGIRFEKTLCALWKVNEFISKRRKRFKCIEIVLL